MLPVAVDAAYHCLSGDDGYLLWRYGTGHNVEITHLRAYRKGGGRRLLQSMLGRLVDDRPYATVYGFTRTCNEIAQDFYQRMGFTLSPVKGVYADGDAVVFSANYDDLLKLHCGEEK